MKTETASDTLTLSLSVILKVSKELPGYEVRLEVKLIILP